VKNSFGHVGYDGHVITLLRVFFRKILQELVNMVNMPNMPTMKKVIEK